MRSDDAMSGTPGSERTIGQLVADVTHDVEGIVRGEIALAKAEILGGAKGIGKGAGLFAVAGFVGLLGLIFLFHTLARVVGIWLPLWAGYAIVTAVMFLLAGVLALLGRSAIRKAKPAPERAIDQAQQTVAALKQAGQSSDALPAATERRASA
ncbi:MAG: phage holin family protein [Dermatophilaceae bacterium]